MKSYVMYQRVFIYCSDKLYLEELYLQLSAQLPGASIICCQQLADALAILKQDKAFDLVMVSAKSWTPCLFADYRAAGQKPPLVFLLEDRERRSDELFARYSYCLQAPFREQHVRFTINELRKKDVLRLDSWDFLLLKLEWRYTSLAIDDIAAIKRRDTLCVIVMKDGREYDCFYSLSHLMTLLPPAKFVKIKRGLVVPMAGAAAYLSQNECSFNQ